MKDYDLVARAMDELNLDYPDSYSHDDGDDDQYDRDTLLCDCDCHRTGNRDGCDCTDDDAEACAEAKIEEWLS